MSRFRRDPLDQEYAGAQTGDAGSGWPAASWKRPLVIANEGSTARDFLARERNFLSWVKVTLYLLVISAALLLRFQLGREGSIPQVELNADTPLGVLFFVAALCTIAIGTSGYFGVTKSYFQKKGFAYAGRIGEAVIAGIGLLIVTTCIILLAAN
ncbi:DUF202 domain-containing protein [Sporobolomyces koalae]|uniref:DUF202 domain-containing protein n=1 Tax=Sporobolomyces koalae TaxID=500713 RepID=UPI00316C6722